MTIVSGIGATAALACGVILLSGACHSTSPSSSPADGSIDDSLSSVLDASTDLPPASTLAPIDVGGVLLSHDYLGASYDYNPSIIHSGSLLRFWWCGGGPNPGHAGYVADNIYYASWDTVTSRFVQAPTSVFAEGAPGTWDDYLDCNPSVIAGNFSPFGDGMHYTLALYYVAIPTTTDVNRIGVAFSNDGISWRRWLQPVISAPFADTTHCSNTYGIGSPSTYSIDGQSSVRLFFEDYCNFELFSATTQDGVHFAARESVSKAGLGYCNTTSAGGIPTDANLVFDPAGKDWYATMDLGCSNAQRETERGTIGFKLFRKHGDATASLASGPWQELATIDTSLNGSEINSWPAPTRDQFGNLDLAASHGLVQIFYTVANPRVSTTSSTADFAAASSPTHWDIAYSEYRSVVGATTPLERFQGATHEVTTGFVDRGRFPVDEGSLGLVYEGPQGTLTTALYNCQQIVNGNFFVSTDLRCEGQRIVGLIGYVLNAPHGVGLPLYRCATTGGDSFVSHDAACEGASQVSLLGYTR